MALLCLFPAAALAMSMAPTVLDLGRGRSMQLLVPAAEADQLDAAAQITGFSTAEIADQLALLRDIAGDEAVPTSARMSAVVWPASHSFASLLVQPVQQAPSNQEAHRNGD